MKYVVRRLDENPDNKYTFNTWIRMTEFATEEQALDFIKRASGPTQKLKLVMEEEGRVLNFF